jgi:predicted enzyme related to lactoylglutathione lyase
MSQADQDRRIDYVEFGTQDLAATKRFFETAFGWKLTDWGDTYTAFEDGRLNGGFRPDRAPGAAPTVILYATDLDATRERVRAAGGEIVDELTFPGGRRFHFREPGGNELAVWSEQ